MGCCRICAWLRRTSHEGELVDRSLRTVHAAGPRKSFLRAPDRLTGRVLEVGCGTGLLFEDYLADADLVAVDNETEFLANRSGACPTRNRPHHDSWRRRSATAFRGPCF